MPRARGKPDSFTEKENAAMRHVLRSLTEQHGWTQAVAGAKIGASQQTAARLLSVKHKAGFSRPTALALAKLCGFDSPESMLADLGALAGAKAPGGWPDRDLAAGIARRHGYDEKAIERVIARYTESQYASRPVKWWMTRFGLEDQELAEERRSAVAPPPSASSLPEAPARRSRKESA